MTLSNEERAQDLVGFERDVHAAYVSDEYVFLDLARDVYCGIDFDDSQRLSTIIGKLGLDALGGPERELVETLKREGILETSKWGSNNSVIQTAKEMGGLSICQWRPHLAACLPLSGKIGLARMAKAFLALARTERILVGGIKALAFRICNKRVVHKYSRKAFVRSDFADLVMAIEIARRWYPRKVDCLVGSGALALLALSEGIACALVIGVQKFPFYAHAWVEYSGEVMNDDSEVQRRLAPILTLAPNQR